MNPIGFNVLILFSIKLIRQLSKLIQKIAESPNPCLIFHVQTICIL